LIELLAVIAIIGLLAGMMMPALSKVRGVAQSAYCKNNLRQLGIGFHSYLNDNGGYAPYVEPMPGVPAYVIGAPYDSLYNILIEHVNGSAKVFKCPADYGSATSTAVTVSYYDDGSDAEREGSTAVASTNGKSDFDVNKSSYEFNEFLSGRRIKLYPWAMLMHDYRTYHGKPGTRGAMNYLFEDGHVGDFK
jgi:type II secretory pathway pseudopilin PulG